MPPHALPHVCAEHDAFHVADARGLSLCFLHWLHAEAGLTHWQPATNVLGTPDGLAQQSYVRRMGRWIAESF